MNNVTKATYLELKPNIHKVSVQSKQVLGHFYKYNQTVQ